MFLWNRVDGDEVILFSRNCLFVRMPNFHLLLRLKLVDKFVVGGQCVGGVSLFRFGLAQAEQ